MLVTQPFKNKSLKSLSFALFKAYEQVGKDKNFMNHFIPEIVERSDFKIKTGILIPKITDCNDMDDAISRHLISFTNSGVHYNGSYHKWKQNVTLVTVDVYLYFGTFSLKVPDTMSLKEKVKDVLIHDVFEFIKHHCVAFIGRGGDCTATKLRVKVLNLDFSTFFCTFSILFFDSSAENGFFYLFIF